MSQLLSTFPEFDLYGMSLLFLVLQGYVFAFLLIQRFRKKNKQSDLFLALLLIITGYSCTSYIIGFMSWYDTYRTTKINYVLIDLILAIGPLIYFYIKSITSPSFRFRKQDWVHFLPVLLYILYSLSYWIFDASQEGFSQVQNGVWKSEVDSVYVQPFYERLTRLSITLYLAFSIHSYLSYRTWIVEQFSNTYRVELTWIRNFLFMYTLLFLIQEVIFLIDAQIHELHWTQKWWAYLASAITVYYLGTKGYFSNLDALAQITPPEKEQKRQAGDSSIEEDRQKENVNPQLPKAPTNMDQTELELHMQYQKPYLNPDLTLAELAQEMSWTPIYLSHIVNQGIGKNFNDFVNEYRVEAVKKMLLSGSHQKLSLLGIAYECGFSSKATFNRTFRKFVHSSPSEYISRHTKGVVS